MRSLLLATILALSACAPGSGQAPTTNNGQAAASEEGLVCKDEAPTGSNFKRRVCRSSDQVGDDRKGADDMLRQQNSRLGQANN